MNRLVEDLMCNVLNMDITHEYHFRKHCGFTFALRYDTIIINEELSSISIEPVGIIYEENGEYYYAPLDSSDEIAEIIKEFCQKQ